MGHDRGGSTPYPQFGGITDTIVLRSQKPVHPPLTSPPQGHCVAALVALLELMSPRHYQMLRQTFTNASELEVCVFVCLSVCLSVCVGAY